MRRLVVLVVMLSAVVAAACTPPGPQPPPPPGSTTPDEASAPWTVPTRPPACTSAQAASGDVASCVLLGAGGLPPARGFADPPFPETADPVSGTWTDLARGATGPTVKAVQDALNAAIAAGLVPDGVFGPRTEAAVIAFQTARALSVTGIVDRPTADALGVTSLVPAPFPPSGWVWSGYLYNGSPALGGWEGAMVRSSRAHGPIKAGWLQAPAAVLPLFEGFLDEIVAKGYPIRTWGLYGFRCMSTTRKDCYGRDEADLSNHAHGLAIDLNWSENPAVSYSAPSGGTACAVPQMTDMPRWVAQAAERWGLFWMGYGSGSGSCAGPTDQKSRIYRDPMHFEFRGSPDQARAILAARGVAEAAAAPESLGPPPPVFDTTYLDD